MTRTTLALLRSLRPEQWLKNGFVLAPLVFSGLLDDPTVWGRGLLAVAAFCAASSAVYLVNDVFDREVDRRHPTKCSRPIAAGEPANLTVFDPNEEWEVQPATLASKSRNTPYVGVPLRGRVRHTLLHGTPTVIEGAATR